MTSRNSTKTALDQTARAHEKSFKWYSKGYVQIGQNFERSLSALEQRRPSQSLPSQFRKSALDAGPVNVDDALAGSNPPCPSGFEANGLSPDLEIDVRWI